MIDIDSAIEKSKTMENVSNGGSPCFDFGDVVLVRYSCPTKYMRDGKRTREKSEEIMQSINEKAEAGVNTPMHLGVKRVVEGQDDVCYVLQKKCPGKNCSEISNYGCTYDEMIKSLNFVLSIPSEQYLKLVIDSCMLYEMGYEKKNKNLFYDTDSGFWFIDFLSNDVNDRFNPSNVIHLFRVTKFIIPKPIQIASVTSFRTELTPEQKEKSDLLKNAINAKTLMTIKSVIPNFERYEKFYLLPESDEYKKYLMNEGFVNKDLLRVTDDDYEVYNELYEVVLNQLVELVKNGASLWSLNVNDIRICSDLFNLRLFFEHSTLNPYNLDEFEDEFDYQQALNKKYNDYVLTDLVNKLKSIEPNENVTSFLEEISKYTVSNGK